MLEYVYTVCKYFILNDAYYNAQTAMKVDVDISIVVHTYDMKMNAFQTMCVPATGHRT